MSINTRFNTQGYDRIERRDEPLYRAGTRLGFLWQQRHAALPDVQHDGAGLEQDEPVFLEKSLPYPRKGKHGNGRKFPMSAFPKLDTTHPGPEHRAFTLPFPVPEAVDFKLGRYRTGGIFPAESESGKPSSIHIPPPYLTFLPT